MTSCDFVILAATPVYYDVWFLILRILKLKQVKSISSSRATTTRSPTHDVPHALAGTPSSQLRRALPRGPARVCTLGQGRAG